MPKTKDRVVWEQSEHNRFCVCLVCGWLIEPGVTHLAWKTRCCCMGCFYSSKTLGVTDPSMELEEPLPVGIQIEVHEHLHCVGTQAPFHSYRDSYPFDSWCNGWYDKKRKTITVCKAERGFAFILAHELAHSRQSLPRPPVYENPTETLVFEFQATLMALQTYIGSGKEVGLIGLRGYLSYSLRWAMLPCWRKPRMSPEKVAEVHGLLVLYRAFQDVILEYL